MNTQELKDAIEEFGYDEFKDLLMNGKYASKAVVSQFKATFGCDPEVTESRTEGSGDYDGYQWILKIGEKSFEFTGYYGSYEGAEIESITDFHEVKQVQKTVTVWERV